MLEIVFLAGPSGCGKSYFAAHLATEHGWHHIELDRYPEGDGIDLANLRAEWDAFFEGVDPDPLYDELSRRSAGVQSVILSFPGNLVFPERHLAAGAGKFHFVYLYGHPALCLKAFLDRERKKERGLKARHWENNNVYTYKDLSRVENHPRLIEAFNPDGSRRTVEEIYVDLTRSVGVD